MKRTGPAIQGSNSRSTRMVDSDPHGRDVEKERRRREWLRQQEREREHERFKRKKIEEWERKRREEELKSDKGRSSYQSRSRSTGHSTSSHRKVEPEASAVKPVMSQKFESSSNSTRLFKGPENTKIDVAELRRIKVDIHRKIPAAEVTTELRREILDPEEVKLKRREGEGAKPIFEREELMASEVPASEVEEHRTVVALDNDRSERRSSHATRKRSTSPTNSHKQHSHNSRRDGDARSSRRGDSTHNAQRSESYRNQKHESERTRSRDRSREQRERHKREDSRERRSPRRTSRHDVSRDHADRHDRSTSRNRDLRRNDSRRRSSRDRASYRENREREDSRDRRSREIRSRDRKIPMPHHYAEAMPVPLYYDGFHPRPIMVGPMIPMRGQMPMGRGRMPIMAPMRPPFPARFMPPEMFRSALNPNQRFGRMY